MTNKNSRKSKKNSKLWNFIKSGQRGEGHEKKGEAEVAVEGENSPSPDDPNGQSLDAEGSSVQRGEVGSQSHVDIRRDADNVGQEKVYNTDDMIKEEIAKNVEKQAEDLIKLQTNSEHQNVKDLLMVNLWIICIFIITGDISRTAFPGALRLWKRHHKFISKLTRTDSKIYRGSHADNFPNVKPTSDMKGKKTDFDLLVHQSYNMFKTVVLQQVDQLLEDKGGVKVKGMRENSSSGDNDKKQTDAESHYEQEGKVDGGQICSQCTEKILNNEIAGDVESVHHEQVKISDSTTDRENGYIGENQVDDPMKTQTDDENETVKDTEKNETGPDTLRPQSFNEVVVPQVDQLKRGKEREFSDAMTNACDGRKIQLNSLEGNESASNNLHEKSKAMSVPKVDQQKVESELGFSDLMPIPSARQQREQSNLDMTRIQQSEETQKHAIIPSQAKVIGNQCKDAVSSPDIFAAKETPKCSRNDSEVSRPTSAIATARRKVKKYRRRRSVKVRPINAEGQIATEPKPSKFKRWIVYPLLRCFGVDTCGIDAQDD